MKKTANYRDEVGLKMMEVERCLALKVIKRLAKLLPTTVPLT